MSRKYNRCYVGFTIAELLLALALTAILLAGMAVAFNASMTNYRQNEDIFKSVNSARQALFRMTTQIRTGFVDPNDITNQQQCRLLCADATEISYWYDDANNRLYLRDIAGGTDYLLCENVTLMSFIKTPTDDGLDVKSVQISMTVKSGTVEKTLSAAAVVRKVLQ